MFMIEKIPFKLHGYNMINTIRSASYTIVRVQLGNWPLIYTDM
jgi:hypothetical protein